MQRPFFMDEERVCIYAPESELLDPNAEQELPPTIPERLWEFCVKIDDYELHENEIMAVTGNCDALGNWQLDGVVIMSKNNLNNWIATITIPANSSVSYRYLICAIIDHETTEVNVRRWETHLKPRVIVQGDLLKSNCPDIFGYVNGVKRVDRGWLSSGYILQLKFFNAPFTWFRETRRQIMHVKVTPVDITDPTLCEKCVVTKRSFPHVVNNPSASVLFNEVMSLRNNNGDFVLQPQFGTACGETDLVFFHFTSKDFMETAFKIELYSYQSKAAPDEPADYEGYYHVLPKDFKRAEGKIKMPINSPDTHRLIGAMKFEYLIIKPHADLLLDLALSYTRYWNNDKWHALDVALSDFGLCFHAHNTSIQEITLSSLDKASNRDAEAVKIDVQLTRDLVPIIYNNLMVNVYINRFGRNYEFLQLPISELTLAELEKLKIFRANGRVPRAARVYEFTEEKSYRPFPTLIDALNNSKLDLAFQIDVKWFQKHEPCLVKQITRNAYIDAILEVLIMNAKNRRIILSSFDPDICTLLRYKQNRYPVIFSMPDSMVTSNHDPRCQITENAVFHAVAMELLGILTPHLDYLTRDPHAMDLSMNYGCELFCWNLSDNLEETLPKLNQMIVKPIIFYKMAAENENEEQEHNIFMLLADEMETGRLMHIERQQCLQVS